MIDSGFETKSLRMELLLLVTFQAPAADVERIMEAVVAITPLRMGKYDGNAYQSAQGIEPLPDARRRCRGRRDRVAQAAGHGRGVVRTARRSGARRPCRRSDIPGPFLPGACDPHSAAADQPFQGTRRPYQSEPLVEHHRRLEEGRSAGQGERLTRRVPPRQNGARRRLDLTFRARSLCVAPSFPRPGVFPVLQRPKLHEH